MTDKINDGVGGKKNLKKIMVEKVEDQRKRVRSIIILTMPHHPFSKWHLIKYVNFLHSVIIIMLLTIMSSSTWHIISATSSPMLPPSLLNINTYIHQTSLTPPTPYSQPTPGVLLMWAPHISKHQTHIQTQTQTHIDTSPIQTISLLPLLAVW